MTERERERERGREGKRERERGKERAIHVWLIHSIFVVAFILFFFTLRTVYVFWIGYKIDGISSNPYRSVSG